MKVGYYPGCVVPISTKEYDISTREVFKALDVELVELDDWNCCGASAVYNIDSLLSSAISARNLAIAERDGLEVITSACPVCYYNLWRVEEHASEPGFIENINHALEGTGLEYKGDTKVKHILDILVNDVGLEKISSMVVRPLDGLRVIPYYGCFLVRPPRKERFDSPENPTSMDKLLSAIGAEVVDWDMKTKCCGGTIVLTNEEVMLKLSYDLLGKAKSLKTDCISTPCPQCNLSLDSKQMDIEKAYNERIDIPVVYFTQLMGMAFGIDPKRLGLDLNIVPTEKMVETLKTS